MGWSCRADAAETMEKWTEKCRTNSGSANVWGDRGGWFMFDASRVEHDDGAITGSILRFDADPRGAPSMGAKVTGSFRINPDGSVARAPRFLREA